MEKQLEDLQAKIAAHPWPIVGAAFALGAIIALGTRKGDERRSIGSMVAAGLGAVALRLVKSYALGKLGDAAKDWIGDRVNAMGSTEQATSRQPAVESFLEH
jgi:hypothetical protein